ncbi:hypothetical protein [Actinokineospora sp. HUAS TT18]|uniref:hypothetical protein n=1 Tax=Actinokineospora sp. HUAS TT18 TaxID=3447451 RepID=UPI003F522617
MKSVVSAVVGAAVVASSFVLAAPVASADANTPVYSSCAGTRKINHPIKNAGGTTIAHVEVYYSSASNGTNCAIVRHAGPLVGVATMTYVSLEFSTGTQGTVYDFGNYEYFAGAIRKYGTNNRCVNIGYQISSYSGKLWNKLCD